MQDSEAEEFKSNVRMPQQQGQRQSNGGGRGFRNEYAGEEGYIDAEESKRDQDAVAVRRHVREMFMRLPLTVSPFAGTTTNLVHCVIIRKKGGGGTSRLVMTVTLYSWLKRYN